MKKITYLLVLSALFIANQTFAQENVISENGNIGIGTTTPNARLQVAGSARFDSTVVANDSVSMTRNVTIGGDLKVGGNVYFPNIPTMNGIHNETILFSNGEGLTSKFSVLGLKDFMYTSICDLAGGITQSPAWANGPNKIFIECPSVFVGIGTNTPTRNLDVVGNTKVSGHLWTNTSFSVGADLNTFSKFNLVNTNRTAAIQVNTAGNSKPYQRLMFFEYDNPDTKILEVINTATGRTPFSLKADGAMDIDNGVTNILHLGTDGMFSISNGVRKTFVVEASGLTRARKIKVDADVWADYVFEDNYVLMPLTDVENFLKEHKHLPSIPSEKVMKEEGIDVAEMNVKMMEKIEELTLYLIQQNKELEKLKAELETLKQQKP
ncbi:hypothetical protein D3C87_22080 [compost metagenome]